MPTGRSEAFSRILIDRALQDSGWDFACLRRAALLGFMRV